MRKEKGALLQALTRLVQVITLILVVYCVQFGLGVVMGFILLLSRVTQSSGIL